MKNFGLAVLYITVFGLAAVDKFAAPEVPEWFLKQFSPTVLGYFSATLPLQFYGLAALEAAVTGIMLASLFARANYKPALLRWGLILAFWVFVALGFGERLSQQYHVAAELFAYAALTFLILRDVEKG